MPSEEANVNYSTETRANYFLRCLTDVDNATADNDNATATASHSGARDTVPGHPDTDAVASYEDNCDHDYDNDEERQNQIFQARGTYSKDKTETERDYTDEEYEAAVSNKKENAVAVATPSLLDDNIVLQSLRAYSSKANSRNCPDVSSEGGPESRNETHQQQGDDPTVALFFKFFKFAQMERLEKAHNRPYMILGLFANLSDIRSDLEWAQDAAYRRHAEEPYVAWRDYYAKERQGVLKRPIFISLTLFVSSVMMFWAFYKNEWKIEPLKTNPLIGPSPRVLLECGALQGRALIEDGKWWLLITPIFLHAGIAHFFLNAILLVFVCRTIERNHGSLHTGVLFIVSGMFGNAISALLQPNYILLGASGGIYGLIGACIGDIVLNSRFFFLVLEERVQEETHNRERQHQQQQPQPQPQNTDDEHHRSSVGVANGGRKVTEIIGSDAVREADPFAIQCRRRRRVRFWCYFSLVCDLLLNSLFGLLPFVDNFAHLGGLIFGFFLSLSSLRLLSASSFDYRKKQQKMAFGRWCHRLRILTLRCGGMISALFLVFVAFLFLGRSDGINSPCPSCRYASCISLPRFWEPNDTSNWWTCDECGGVAAQVYSGIGINRKYYVNLEMFCPQGDIMYLDIFDKRYTMMEQVSAVLADLCRTFCKSD